ncbi:MAG: L-threonylcarbamoyladenylate synthase [Myxococcaceae bacterium]
MPTEVQRAVSLLKNGSLVALPTETVYGLGADADNELAVRRIFAVKGRPSSHPLIVHVHSAEAAKSYVSAWPREAELLAARWPGPLTLVLPRSPRASDAVTGGQETVAVRVPNHPLALEVLRELGGGIAAPSANKFGKLSPTSAEDVRADLGDEVEQILDGGRCSVGVESTIVDLSSGAPRILRPGGMAKEEIEQVLGRAVPLATQESNVRAPGMLASHYAPRAGLVLTTSDKLADDAAQRMLWGAEVAVLSPGKPVLPEGARHFSISADPAEAARQLYATLRSIDEAGFDVIVAVLPGEEGLGLAVRDRLARAAAPRK